MRLIYRVDVGSIPWGSVEVPSGFCKDFVGILCLYKHKCVTGLMSTCSDL